MNQYKIYPKYKDSGVEWLGEIPDHWELASLKYLVSIKDGTHDTPKYIEPSENSYPLITSKDTTSGYIDFSKAKHISQTDYININRRSNVVKHDIIMPMIGSVGNPVIVSESKPFSIKNVALFKTSESKINTKYLCYYINSNSIKTQFQLESRGGVQDFVSLGLLQNVFAFKISDQEQKTIANYLDRATAKIDTLMAKQSRLIELLREKRQALISTAVTRGLNPDVPMKDSGVAWLGEIPEHWRIPKIKYFALTDSGGTPTSTKRKEYYDNGIFPWIRTTDLNNAELFTAPIKITKKALEDTACNIVKEGSVLIGMYGGAGTIGKHALLHFSSTINQAVCAITPNQHVISKYLHYFIQFYRPYWMIGAMGTRKDPNIGQETIINRHVPIPPYEEQENIIILLNEKTSKIDQLVTKAKKAIELLKERRTALISAVVTGKIDVRESANLRDIWRETYVEGDM